jgi:hypothetical protein
MTLSAPALGGLFGVGFVLVIGFAVQRSNAREQQRRLDIIAQKIERRQAAIRAAAPEVADDTAEAGGDGP